MRHAKLFPLAAICFLVCSTVFALRTEAQETRERRPPNFKALVHDLASPRVGVRSNAVAQLNMVPVSATPSSARDALIALLKREATAPLKPETENAENYHEYIFGLVDAVIRLDDARGLRGVALLGIETSRAAQEFVVRQGPAALAALDEAWTKPAVRPDVIATWGLLLASAPPWLSSDARYRILQRIAAAATEEPIAIASVERDDGVVALMPFLAPPPEDADDPIVVGAMDKGLAALRNRMSALPVTSLLSELAVGTRLFCAGATTGNRSAACTTIQSLIATTTRHISAGEFAPAHSTLQGLVARAEQAGNAGALSATEVRFIREVVTSAGSRLQ